jgi:type IV pilus assembly protein PilE
VDTGGAAPSYTFTLSATPIAGSPAADDECGTLIIDQTGAKTVDGASLSAAECWNR